MVLERKAEEVQEQARKKRYGDKYSQQEEKETILIGVCFEGKTRLLGLSALKSCRR